ncbi:MAG: glycosyltransferase [Candidatus Levybacteria bacterium]|nr:glycosyltransferase [Candidatus Levybacteria bacterium]
MIHISIVIPAHNEEATVARMVTLLFRHFSKHIEELIVINDCSTDRTAMRLNKLQKEYPRLKIIHRRDCKRSQRMRATYYFSTVIFLRISMISGNWYVIMARQMD